MSYQYSDYAVGSALLAYANEKSGRGGRGGSFGGSLDVERAESIAKIITGPELLELLRNAAREGGEGARREYASLKYQIKERARAIAEMSDSLSLWRFIEQLDDEE